MDVYMEKIHFSYLPLLCNKSNLGSFKGGDFSYHKNIYESVLLFKICVLRYKEG